MSENTGGKSAAEESPENGVPICAQKRCNAPATHEAAWAGEFTAQCETHIRQLARVACAMGYPCNPRPIRAEREGAGA